MTFKIEELPKQKAAYMRRVGPYGPNNKALMEKLKSWAASNNLFTDTAIILGIAQDDPAATLPQNCRYDACIVVPREYQIKGANINVTELPGGRYAVFTLPHTAEDIQKAWARIRPDLSGQEYRIDPVRLVFERYIPALVKNNLCEICVPVL